MFKNQAHTNVFQSLTTAGGSANEYNAKHHMSLAAGSNKNSKKAMNTSANITNISTNRSPRQRNSLDDPNTSREVSQGGANIFNFQPQTQRTNVNLDPGVEQDSLIQDLDPNFDNRVKDSIGQFGEVSQAATKPGANNKDSRNKQKPLQTTLQPKLIMPPQKL